ncbi:MAG: hypothetical protein Q9163_004465 [Psora crenata]
MSFLGALRADGSSNPKRRVSLLARKRFVAHLGRRGMATHSGRRSHSSADYVATVRESKATRKLREVPRDEDDHERSHRRHRRRQSIGRGTRETEEILHLYKPRRDENGDSGLSIPSVVRRSTVTGVLDKRTEERVRERPRRRESDREPSRTPRELPVAKHGRRDAERGLAWTKVGGSRVQLDAKGSERGTSYSKHTEEAPSRSGKRSGSGDMYKSSKHSPDLLRGASVRETPSSSSRHQPLNPSKVKITSRQPQPSSNTPSTTPTMPSRVEPPQARVSRAPSVKKNERPTSIIGSLFGPTKPTLPPKPERRVECLTCLTEEPLSKTTHLQCGHNMCHGCMQRLFTLSLSDPAHMPPKCCDPTKPIELAKIEHLFDRSFKHKWNRKYAEFTTKNRLYCPTRGCGAWIKPRYIFLDRSSGPNGGRKYGVCKTCKRRVCCTCNNKYHASRECPKDPATQEFLKTAKEQGWQRCYNCKATVELAHGCNHMTCRCGAEFCMVCGTEWKGCSCVLFDDTMIDRDRREHQRRDPGWLREFLGLPVDADPVMNRQPQREQERGDEALARQLQAMGLDVPDADDDVVEGNDLYIRGYDIEIEVSNARAAAVRSRNEPFVRRTHEIHVENYNPAQHRAADRRVTEARNAALWDPAPPPPPVQPVAPPLRRHSTASHNHYGNDVRTRPAEYLMQRRVSAMDYLEEPALHRPAPAPAPAPARPPIETRRASLMAGIHRGQSGEGRVHEWRRHVDPGINMADKG